MRLQERETDCQSQVRIASLTECLQCFVLFFSKAGFEEMEIWESLGILNYFEREEWKGRYRCIILYICGS